MPVFNKPKILLVDCEEEARRALADVGFNVLTGSFGSPYEIKQGDGFSPVIVNPILPNYAEQEIVIVSLHVDGLSPEPSGPKHTSPGDLDWWAKASQGFIDPRPRAMVEVKPLSDRILNHGGAFIVFADQEITQSLVKARWDSYHRTVTDQTSLPYTNWSFLTALDPLKIIGEHGHEIDVNDKSSPLGKALGVHLNDATFTCTIGPNGYGYQDHWKQYWRTIAVNKYEQPVGVASLARKSRGVIILLPRLRRQVEFIVELIRHVLPETSPHLFPYATEGRWKYHAEYELPRIVELNQRKSEVEQRRAKEIEAISIEIEQERKVTGWLHDLLTAQDKPLVDAVKKALGILGFVNVQDVDQERDQEGQSHREDLRIDDQRPTLIVDIKGIIGVPSDEHAFQSDKHATIRMREWDRTDVVALTIINHQRHLPPLDRENMMPFRQEILDHAHVSKLVLLTTWDLHRLVRNFQKNGWNTDHVKPLFYRCGRMEIIPCHYEYIGQIANVWREQEAFSVTIEKGQLEVGSRIGIELPIEFIEVDITSLQIEGDSVETCGDAGVEVGIKTEPHFSSLKKGTRVFRIKA